MTLAPGTTAPLASVTVPRITPNTSATAGCTIARKMITNAGNQVLHFTLDNLANMTSPFFNHNFLGQQSQSKLADSEELVLVDPPGSTSCTRTCPGLPVRGGTKRPRQAGPSPGWPASGPDARLH